LKELKRIWLIGGTQESVTLAIALANCHLPCVVSVTTDAAVALYSCVPKLQICVGKLVSEELPRFLTSYNIGVVLDASHPFAVEISRAAIWATAQAQIPYLRFERTVTSAIDRPDVISVANFEDVLDLNLLQGQRVLFTIGYRFLSVFESWHDQATLFARILPSPVALEAALKAGFTSDRLIALRPPISYDLERSLWQQWQISTVITKASGAPGGEDIKRKLAAELGVKLIVIERPTLPYPQQTSDVTQALEFCRQSLHPDSTLDPASMNRRC
jgi:precorrin-6A/cobalt-precorrin-6A reductase